MTPKIIKLLMNLYFLELGITSAASKGSEKDGRERVTEGVRIFKLLFELFSRGPSVWTLLGVLGVKEDGRDAEGVEGRMEGGGVEDLRIEAVGVVAGVPVFGVTVAAPKVALRGVAVGIEEVELRITDRVFEVGVREGVDVEMV